MESSIADLQNTTNSFKVILAGAKLSQLNERQFKIWGAFDREQKDNCKNLRAGSVRYSRQTINYDLAKMQELGLIHLIGKSRNTYYETNFLI